MSVGVVCHARVGARVEGLAVEDLQLTHIGPFIEDEDMPLGGDDFCHSVFHPLDDRLRTSMDHCTQRHCISLRHHLGFHSMREPGRCVETGQVVARRDLVDKQIGVVWVREGGVGKQRIRQNAFSLRHTSLIFGHTLDLAVQVLFDIPDSQLH